MPTILLTIPAHLSSATLVLAPLGGVTDAVSGKRTHLNQDCFLSHASFGNCRRSRSTVASEIDFRSKHSFKKSAPLLGPDPYEVSQAHTGV